MRVMSKAVSICKRRGWLFRFTDIFRFNRVGRKVATRLLVCFSFQSAFVMWSVVVLCTGGVQNPLCTSWLHLWQQCVLNGHFLAKYQPAQFQQADWGFFYVELGDVECSSPWMVLIVDVVAGTDCCIISESCFRFTSCRHSSAACCRIMSRFCSIFERILMWTSIPCGPQPTKIKHLNCSSVMDEILSHSHSLFMVPANVVKSTVSYFVIFRQLNLALKNEVCSLKIFKVSTVSGKLQSCWHLTVECSWNIYVLRAHFL